MGEERDITIHQQGESCFDMLCLHRAKREARAEERSTKRAQQRRRKLLLLRATSGVTE